MRDPNGAAIGLLQGSPPEEDDEPAEVAEVQE
jgi:hypothetical protein